MTHRALQRQGIAIMTTRNKSPVIPALGGNPKRGRAEDEEDGPSRPAKNLKSDAKGKTPVHPFFGRKDDAEASSSVYKPFVWLPPIGRQKTCYHGIHLEPKPSGKVAAFDMDGTLIRPRNAGRWPKDEFDWEFWYKGRGNEKVVPNKLKQLVDDGYAIVIISNQSVPDHIKSAVKRTAYMSKWYKKLPLLAEKLSDIPFHIFVASAKDEYRKPLIGSWGELEKLFTTQGTSIDLAQSFYVGDAAGRRGDHNVTDRLFAMNNGIKFYTPEEYFHDTPSVNYEIKTFHPLTIPFDPEVPLYTPTAYPLALVSDDPNVSPPPEIVLFIGYPATGKTTFYNKHFKPHGYIHINQDILKTRQKCLKRVSECLRAGQSCIVVLAELDNTNRDVVTRSEYIELAEARNVPIRAFHFNMPMELAWHVNVYRAFCLTDDSRLKEAPRQLLPYVAYTSFKEKFEKPEKEEGFKEVKTINWIFEGSEEERRRFNMYLDF